MTTKEPTYAVWGKFTFIPDPAPQGGYRVYMRLRDIGWAPTYDGAQEFAARWLHTQLNRAHKDIDYHVDQRVYYIYEEDK